MSAHTCCAEIFKDYRSYKCGCTAKFERDGRHYCGTHDPVAVNIKRAISNAKWKEKSEKNRARRMIELAAPDMLAALIAFEEFGNVMIIRRQISAAIAKATGVAA